jgi:hypothetical protein
VGLIFLRLLRYSSEVIKGIKSPPRRILKKPFQDFSASKSKGYRGRGGLSIPLDAFFPPPAEN